MSASVKQITDADFQREVMEADVPVIVDFWAPWCGPCRLVAPEMEKAAERLNGQAAVVKVNVDENPALAATYGVMSIPTILVFHRGKQIGRHVGFIGADPITTALEEYLATPA